MNDCKENDIFSDSDDEIENDRENDKQIELGFVKYKKDASKDILIHENLNWSKWNEGKIGGKPSWLHPEDIPSLKDLQCTKCFVQLSFLLQIYCPIDDIKDAFHRTLYIFICKNDKCTSQGYGKVFRCQLPQANEFYPFHGETKTMDKKDKKINYVRCSLCNQRGNFICGKCHKTGYCSKEHQEDHWKNGHKHICDNGLLEKKIEEEKKWRRHISLNGTKCLFPEYEMEIEVEPDSNVAMNNMEAELIQQMETNTNNKSNPLYDEGDIDITQQEIYKILGGSENMQADPFYVSFLTKTVVAKDQILRYVRWPEQNKIANPGPLWLHKNDQIKKLYSNDGVNWEYDVPNCTTCGGKRLFEFQILPQLLTYLKCDGNIDIINIKSSPSCDWGTLVIYTCINSCKSENRSYVEEYIWRQEPYHGDE